MCIGTLPKQLSVRTVSVHEWEKNTMVDSEVDVICLKCILVPTHCHCCECFLSSFQSSFRRRIRPASPPDLKMSPEQLPPTYRALVLTSASQPAQVQSLPLPSTPPAQGTALLRVLATPVLSYANQVFQQGNPRNYTYPAPLVPGPSSCIARVAAVPKDAARLRPGDLVWVDATVVARDDDQAVALQGLFDGFSEGSRTLMREAFRDGSMAEYLTAPLENLCVLNEEVLLKKLGYDFSGLAFLFWPLVPYGGLRDVGLRVGEKIIVAPATGPFGGVAVLVALAMGAGKVVAMGRNAEALQTLRKGREGRVETVQITGDIEMDADQLLKAGGGPADVYFDISPPQATGSTHLASAFRALKRGARVSLMGGIMADVALPHAIIMHKDITIKGKWMYPKEAIPELVRMVELGIFKLGSVAGIEAERYSLDDWEAAFKAAEASKFGRYVVLNP